MNVTDTVNTQNAVAHQEQGLQDLVYSIVNRFLSET